MVDASERLQVLLSQEEVIYKTSDYLARMQSQQTSDATTSSSSSSNSPKKRKSCEDDQQRSSAAAHAGAGDDGDEDGTSSSQINKHWREKICEWAYQGTFALDPTIIIVIFMFISLVCC